jgi:hypothetical protein
MTLLVICSRFRAQLLVAAVGSLTVLNQLNSESGFADTSTTDNDKLVFSHSCL